ncbi:hypothetical protein A3715_10235 [Oleiphilus sp. HI0009]|nr:hypothetical protein A3715_10235 [Oleiphilus sp. HI0009]
MSLESIALILHRQKADKGYSYNGDSNIAVNKHAIHVVDGRPIIGEGHVLNDEDISGIADILLEREKQYKKKTKQESTNLMFDRQVLKMGFREIAWVAPSEKRYIGYRDKENIVQFEQVPCPTLVMHYKKGTFRVCALKTNNVKKTSNVFYAPYGNVNVGHRLCVGANRKHLGYQTSKILKMEEMFFESIFCELQKSGVQGVSDYNELVDFFASLINKDSYPKSTMIRVKGKKLFDWLEEEYGVFA